MAALEAMPLDVVLSWLGGEHEGWFCTQHGESATNEFYCDNDCECTIRPCWVFPVTPTEPQGDAE